MKRLPLIFSSAALVVALVGNTSLGSAAGRAVAKVVPFAQRAGTAKVANNALRLNGHAASLTGAPGTIPVVGANGKLPVVLATIGSAGSTGAPGALGAQGPPGPAGAQGPNGVVAALTSAAETGTCCASVSSANSGAPVTSLALPTGRWAIFAKVHLDDEPAGGIHKTEYSAICHLVAGNDTDYAEVQGTSGTVVGGVGAGSTASMSLIHEFTAPGTASLNCFSPASAPAGWTDARITAIQVVGTVKVSVGVGKVTGGAGSVKGG